jgi:FKBP-type peptidyl-prolyl cis-trans isomerase FkpA
MSPRVNPMVRTLTVLALLGACGGGGSGPAAVATTVPQPIAGDVERTQFAEALNVHLDQMVKRASGLYVQDLTMGTGTFASRGRTAVVRYTGWRADGKRFDEGEITITLGTRQTIAAWEEGLLGMRVGGKRRLVVPPNLGYGARGAGSDIPPNTVLVFDMTLNSIY